MKREQIVTFFFFALLVFVLYQFFLILSPFLTAMFWAGIIAFATYPVYDWLRRRRRVSENVAAFLTTAIILLVVLPCIFVVLVTLASQAIQGYENAREWVDQGGLEQIQERLRSVELVRKLEERIQETGSFSEPAQWDVGKALGVLRSMAGFVAVRVGNLTGNIVLFLVNLLLMVVLIFFFLRDGKKIYDYLYKVTPMEEDGKKLVFGRVRDVFSAVIRGQFITSTVQGTLAWIVFLALGLPLALFFGFLTALSSMIPVTGAGLVWIPMTIVLVATGSYGKAVILFIAGAVGISLVDNVLKPILIGEKTRIPLLLLFLGILGGLKVYGLTGIFLAPLLLSLFFVLIQIYREKYPDLSA
jgi:predicted PurR-regulated permease PerM